MPEPAEHQLELVGDSARERLLAKVRKLEDERREATIKAKAFWKNQEIEKEIAEKQERELNRINKLKTKFLYSLQNLAEKEYGIHYSIYSNMPKDEFAELPGLIMHRIGYKAIVQLLTLSFAPLAKLTLWWLEKIINRKHEDAFAVVSILSGASAIVFGTITPLGLYSDKTFGLSGAILLAGLGWAPALLTVVSMAAVNIKTVTRLLGYFENFGFTDRLRHCFRHYRLQKHLGGPEKLMEFMKAQTRL